MRTLSCQVFGPPASLTVVEADDPVPGPGEVVVEVDAVGVGFVDGLLIQGKYQIRPRLPFVPGNEFAGRVAALYGGGSGALRPGDAVFGLAPGAFSERIVVPESACYPVPSGFDAAQAAGFLLNSATVLFGLDECAGLKPGSTVLVLGASGGVGCAAITVAKALDLVVIAAASTPEKVAAAVSFGAAAGVCYGVPDWRESLKAVLAGRRLDAVLDPVGGKVAEAALRSLSPGGRYLVVGFAGGSVPSIPLNLVLLKRCSVVGVDWGGASRADATLTPRLVKKLLEMAERGRLSPPPVVRQPLFRVREALTSQLAGSLQGKLVIETADAWPALV